MDSRDVDLLLLSPAKPVRKKRMRLTRRVCVKDMKFMPKAPWSRHSDLLHRLFKKEDDLLPFLSRVGCPEALPGLQKLGAKRISDLVFLEDSDIDDLGLAPLDTLKLKQAIDAQRPSASCTTCLIS